MELMEAIRRRHAVRQYTDRPLPPEVLAAVEAQAQQDAMRAASGQAEGLYTPQ